MKNLTPLGVGHCFDTVVFSKKLPTAYGFSFLMDDKAGQRGRMVHVVIVDDEEIMRGLVAEIVTMLGWTSSSAATGLQALHLIEREKPDLVITDVGMPGMSGIELLVAIKDNPNLAHIPVVIMSSIDREIEAREAGCAAFIAKPFTIEAMLQLLPQLVPTENSN